MDFSWGCRRSRFLAFRSQGTRTHFQIHFYPFLNIRECSHNFLLPCRIKLRVGFGFPGRGTRNPLQAPVSGNPEPVPGSHSQEPGTRSGFPFLGTQNPLWVPANRNLEAGSTYTFSLMRPNIYFSFKSNNRIAYHLIKVK